MHVQASNNHVSLLRVLLKIVDTVFQLFNSSLALIDFRRSFILFSFVVLLCLSSSTDLQRNCRDDLISVMSVFKSVSFLCDMVPDGR